MSMSNLLMSASSLVLLAGCFCSTTAAALEGQRKHARLILADVLLLMSGALGATTVLAAAICWSTQGMVGHAVGDIVVGSFMGIMEITVSVLLRGPVSAWSAIRRHRIPRRYSS